MRYGEVLRLLEALEINEKRRATGTRRFRTWLVCGFMPLQFCDFLEAHLNQALPDRTVCVETGIYGDLCGNLERALAGWPDAMALTIEWQDLDSRLGLRQLGGWGPELTEDILGNVSAVLGKIESLLAESGYRGGMALCPPTLPLPPFSHEPGWMAGPAELALSNEVSGFLARLSQLGFVHTASSRELDWISPLDQRFDLRSEIALGFPYTTAHAEVVSRLLATLIQAPAPKKGLITDLDDTVWRGILGEVGPGAVCWDLAGKALIHGIYQQFLAALVSRGVLIAVASKNDSALVQEAFAREDLILKSEYVFPREVGWGRKSEAVGRVLNAWNVGPESVVFVDDSPMELDEVRTSYPEMQTYLFTGHDPEAVYRLILDLQDKFGKKELLTEDRLRLASIRAAAQFGEHAVDLAAAGLSHDDFLARAEARLTIHMGSGSDTARAFELINKTNQFNINGRRLTTSEWQAHLEDPSRFVMVAAYQDKFGPLGIIAVLAGQCGSGQPSVSCWVMSCRAFSRRIEHQCLRVLFSQTGASEILIDYRATPRNQPVREFLASVGDLPSEGPLKVHQSVFLERCPPLFHTVITQ